MHTVHDKFMLYLTVIALGSLSNAVKLVSRETKSGLSLIALNISLPAAVLFGLLKHPFEIKYFHFTALGFLWAAAGLLLFYMLMRGKNRRTKGQTGILFFGYNVGLFGYPIIQGLYGTEGLLPFMAFDIANAFIVFGLAFIIGDFYKESGGEKITLKRIFKTLAKSIPFMAYITGFILNLSSVKITQGPVHDFLKIIVDANTFLMLFILGTFLEKPDSFLKFKKASVILIKRYIPAVLTGGLIYILTPFDPFLKKAAVMALLLPVPLATLPYCVKFGYDRQITGTAANLSLILSFFMIWTAAAFL